MAYTGKIYITDFEGNQVGVSQDVTVLPVTGHGYAAFVVTQEGNERLSDFYETEQAAINWLKGGGTGTVVIDDL